MIYQHTHNVGDIKRGFEMRFYEHEGIEIRIVDTVTEKSACAYIKESYLPSLELFAKQGAKPENGLLEFSEPTFVASDIPTITDYITVLGEIYAELMKNWDEY